MQDEEEEDCSCCFCERVAQWGYDACCKRCAASRGESHDEECQHLLWKPGANGHVLRGQPVPSCSVGSCWEAFCAVPSGRVWYWDAMTGEHLLPWAPSAGWEVAYDPEGNRFWRSSERWFYELR